jgi:signal transduction histidine kinase
VHSRRGTAESERHAKPVRSSPGRYEIISNLSHELRSPLHVLNGYLEILAEDWPPEFSGEPCRILERLRISAAQLTQTVENLLEYAATMSGTKAVVREQIDVSALVTELEAAFAPPARRKKVFLVWRVDRQLKVLQSDRRRLVSIIANLVSNAIKFTDRGGVTVRLRRRRIRHKSMVELEVADTGIGMDEERLDEAFAPFVQLSSSSARSYRGLGLGLALVRRNVASLGATLEVKSKLSAGSRFTVRFPEELQA